jgi:16S rRNA (guanine966-N2)-methyltransferase
MRVIAGTKKGRTLYAVPGNKTRPTTDKVKEAMFNLLGQPYFDGGTALDLFAGTGALGIEALSRGMEKAVFVDIQRQAIETIHQNLSSLSLMERGEVFKNEAQRALKALQKRSIQFDIVFLDPPYAFDDQVIKLLELLNTFHLVQSDGLVIVETAKKTEVPDQIGSLTLWKHQHYGDIQIRIYRQGGS